MNVSDIMNTNVVTVDKDKSVQDAAKLMSKFRVGALIVTKDSRVIGIVTERDMLLKVVAEAMDVNTTKVSEIMTKDVIMVKPELDIEDAAEIMLENSIKRLPVVKENRLIGIVTTLDLISASPKMIERLSEMLLVPKRGAVAG